MHAATNGNQTVPLADDISNLNANPAIAAIPAIILTCVVTFVGAYTWSNRALWRNLPGPVVAASSGGQLPKGAAAGRRVKYVEFEGLTVTVPVGKAAGDRMRVALRNNAMLKNTAALDVQPHDSVIHKLSKGVRGAVGLKSAESTGSGDLVPTESEDMARAADFVVGLHEGDGLNSWSVIKDCSGMAVSGEVVGVLGPSGCGKTTLLSAIAGSATDLGAGTTVGGAVMVDGGHRRGREVAYVPQADYFIPTLTVQECVRYSALLRLPKDTSGEEIQQRVDAVLAELGLRHVTDSQVGGSGHIRGISGGERRRVTIGMELVTDPAIIVLDEPTSGTWAILHSVSYVAPAWLIPFVPGGYHLAHLAYLL